MLCVLVAAVAWNGRQGALVELYDFGEHVASIRELSENLFSPGNPLLASSEPTQRYTPYIFLLAVLVATTPAGVFEAVFLASVLSCAVFVAGVYLFSKDYFRKPYAPPYVLLTFLFLWGKPFGYSNEYSLRFFCYTAFYPSIVAFGCGLLTWYYVLRGMRQNRLYYCGALLIGMAAFVTHPLTGSFVLLGALLLVCTESNNRARNLAMYGAGCALVLGAAIAWPYYPFLGAALDSTGRAWYDFKEYLYGMHIFLKAGPALLGVVAVGYMAVRRRHSFIIAGFSLCFLIYVAGGVFDVYLLDRYLFFTVVFLHLAIAWCFCELDVLGLNGGAVGSTVPSYRKTLKWLGVVLLCGGMFYQGAKLGFEQAGREINFTQRPLVHSYKNPLATYQKMNAVLGPGDIVLSDPLTSWLIPAYTGAKIMVLYHNNPMVSDNERRTRDVETFYDLNTEFEQRKKILAEYTVTHVLLNRNRMDDTSVNRVRNYRHRYALSEELIEDVQDMGRPIGVLNGMELYRIMRD